MRNIQENQHGFLNLTNGLLLRIPRTYYFFRLLLYILLKRYKFDRRKSDILFDLKKEDIFPHPSLLCDIQEGQIHEVFLKISHPLNKYQDNIVDSVEEIQNYVIYLVNKYQGWIDPNSTTDQADPYIIALADYHEGAVVTQEKIQRHLNEHPEQIPNQPHALKIPNICSLENIPYFDLVGFLVEIGDF